MIIMKSYRMSKHLKFTSAFDVKVMEFMKKFKSYFKKTDLTFLMNKFIVLWNNLTVIFLIQ